MSRRNVRGLMFSLEDIDETFTDHKLGSENNSILSLPVKDFLVFLNTSIEYGFVDMYGKVYKQSELDSKEWIKNYRLQINDRLLQTKIGHCWDFVELERFYFDYHKIKNETYFIRDSNVSITHTFLIYYIGTHVYYIESAWFKHKGIYEFDTKNQCLDYVKKIFKDNYKSSPILSHYLKPNKALTQNEFLKMMAK